MEEVTKLEEKKGQEDGPRPKIVRNREVDKEATKLASEHILPVPPGKNLDWDQAAKYFSLLTPGMWAHISVYLYRLRPKIRRQLKNPKSPNYIDCIGQYFDQEYIIARHGGGGFQIQVIDTDVKRSEDGQLLFKCAFDINDTQHPPILDYDELELEARENKSYVQWLQNTGVLDGMGKPTAKAQQPQNPTANTAGLSAKEVLDILSFSHKMNADQRAEFRQQFPTSDDSLSKSVGTILLEKMRQDDPGKDFDRMLAWAQTQMGAMEKLIERANKPDNSFTQFMQFYAQQQTTNLEYTKMLIDANRRDDRHEDDFDKLAKMVTFVKDLMGNQKMGRSGWDTGLEIAKEVVLPGVQLVGNIITNSMALRNGAAPQAPGAQPQSASVQRPFDPYRHPDQMRQYAAAASAVPQSPPAQPQQSAPPPGPQQPAMQPPNPNDSEAMLFNILQMYGNLIVNHLNNSTPGYDFADYVVGLLGTSNHAMIAAPGEETIVRVMMRIPEIALFGEVRLKQFVHEFVNYQQYLESQEEIEEEETETAPPQFYKPAARTVINQT
jgi:hypothetical protein